MLDPFYQFICSNNLISLILAVYSSPRCLEYRPQVGDQGILLRDLSGPNAQHISRTNVQATISADIIDDFSACFLEYDTCRRYILSS